MSNDGSDLKVSREDAPGGCIIRLSGVIDTNFDKERTLALADGAVLIDLDGVKRISSYGVRQWISAMRELRATYVGFVRARAAMVMQFNLMSQFAGKGELLSFYLPYRCPDCDEYTDVLLDVRKDPQSVKEFKPPHTICGACGKQAEFDDVPKTYFAYAAKAAVPAPPSAAEAALSRLA